MAGDVIGLLSSNATKQDAGERWSISRSAVNSRNGVVGAAGSQTQKWRGSRMVVAETQKSRSFLKLARDESEAEQIAAAAASDPKAKRRSGACSGASGMASFISGKPRTAAQLGNPLPRRWKRGWST
jgi:hypothetical protein